ncbi:hypothetical protein GC207_06945 [bacterium]|nr:hypothetical protein [bacterium]
MPSTSPTPANQDVANLNLLAVFHFVVGGLGFVCACIPLIHLAIGIAIIVAPDRVFKNSEPAPVLVGYLFVIVATLFILVGWTAAIFTAVSGWMIKKRRRRMFSFVMGAVLCIFFPFGTVLGVFTLILLNKESVKALYDGERRP